ncbi:MAG: hypothetical protein NVS3B26_12730 [Mycobacteriales bacterium]
MSPSSPHAADVFGHVRVAVSRELETDEVAELVDNLVDRGWRWGQLGHRVGMLPTQPSSAQDAEIIIAMLRRLLEEPSPQVRYDQESARRQLARQATASQAPTPADPGRPRRARALDRRDPGRAERPSEGRHPHTHADPTRLRPLPGEVGLLRPA